jgi:APA family basic amino acid/polyamine antiporter
VFTAALCVDLLIQKPQYTWPGLIIIALGIPMFLFRPRGGARA